MNTEAAANEKVYCHSDYNKTQLKSPDKILMNKSLLNTNHHNNKKSESVVQNESQFSSCNEMTTNLLSLSNRLENILTKEHLSNNLCPALNTNNDSGLTHVSEKSSSGNTSYSTVTSTSYENSSSVNTSFSTVTSTSYKKLAAEDSTTYCSVKTNFQDSFMSQLCELTATTNLNLEDELDNLLNFNSNSTQIYQKETNAGNYFKKSSSNLVAVKVFSWYICYLLANLIVYFDKIMLCTNISHLTLNVQYSYTKILVT